MEESVLRTGCFILSNFLLVTPWKNERAEEEKQNVGHHHNRPQNTTRNYRGLEKVVPVYW